MSTASHDDDPTLQSKADVWDLKRIVFDGKTVPIITQNFNGPCSFIAICNILILRSNITIEPPTRQTVSYEFLSQLVAEYLLQRSPNVDISAALSIMPHTQRGLDLNPIFTSPTSFRPATSTAGGELALFSQVGIELVHGWLIDPDSDEARAMREESAEDYDSAVSLIANADHLAGGLVLSTPSIGGENEEQPQQWQQSAGNDWSDVDWKKIRNAISIRKFLEQTQSQLTYHGLFHLVSTLQPGSLYALFRSSHLSVMYKTESVSPEEGGGWNVLDDTGCDGEISTSELHSSSPPSAPVPNESLSTTSAASPPTHAPEDNPFPLSATSSEPSHHCISAIVVLPPSPTNQQEHGQNTTSQIASHIDLLPLASPLIPNSLIQPQSQQNQSASELASTPEFSPAPAAYSHLPIAPTAEPTLPSPCSNHKADLSPTQPHQQIHSHIYTLATDSIFLHEPSVVWERIEDVDGSAGIFVDGAFRRGNFAEGGDWAREAGAESGKGGADWEGEAGLPMSDAALARRLQAEEDHQYANAMYLHQQEEIHRLHQEWQKQGQQRSDRETAMRLPRQQQEEEEERRRQKELHARRDKANAKLNKTKEKIKDCIVM